MLEANVLFGVTAVVVACLVVWVGVVLKMAKQPWAREPVKSAVVVEGKRGESKLVSEPTAATKAEPEAEPSEKPDEPAKASEPETRTKSEEA